MVLLSSHSVDDHGGPPADSPTVLGSQCHRSGFEGSRGEREKRRGVSSYVAEGLDGAGLGGGPGQTVPHGGGGVGGRVERVLFSQRQHHGVRLRERVRGIPFNHHVIINSNTYVYCGGEPWILYIKMDDMTAPQK